MTDKIPSFYNKIQNLTRFCIGLLCHFAKEWHLISFWRRNDQRTFHAILFMLWPMEHALIVYIDDRDIRPTFCSVMYLKNLLRNIKGDVILCFRIRLSNVSFNNISVISWRSVLLVEETGVPGENHRPAVSHWQTLSLDVVSQCL